MRDAEQLKHPMFCYHTSFNSARSLMHSSQINTLKQQLALKLKQGQIPQAKQLAHKILQHAANDIGVWFVLGQINESLGQQKEAMNAYFNASSNASPNQVTALDRLSFFVWIMDYSERLCQPPTGG
jgi:Tfp pilus assembly protein PilF